LRLEQRSQHGIAHPERFAVVGKHLGTNRLAPIASLAQQSTSQATQAFGLLGYARNGAVMSSDAIEVESALLIGGVLHGG
jgi:hypothetical protein